MNLYLISQDVNSGYDTFDSAVVVASTADAARNIHPHGYEPSVWEYGEYVWVAKDQKHLITVRLIGTALPDAEEGTVLCASFHAG